MSTTYEFYTETFFGKKIPESDFDYYAARAEEYISARCGELPDTENIGKAVCACAEVIFSDELNTVMTSEKVGDYSVTYAESSGSGKSLESRLAAALSLYLPSVRWC